MMSGAMVGTQGHALAGEKSKPGRKISKKAAKAAAAQDKVVKSEAEWKRILTAQQFEVLRQKGTEAPGTGALLHNHEKGIYQCAGCGKELFSSDTKFESGIGWPSFWKPLAAGVRKHEDQDGSGRVEVLCSRCDGHLGHVFEDGPKPTGLRYCMNSVALKFKKKPYAPADHANPDDFSLQAATSDATFKLSEARGKFVVLHFLLKTECPYCLTFTRKYFTQASTLPDVVQVFIKPDSVQEIKAWAAKLPPGAIAKNPIYRDPDAQLADAFGIPNGYRFHGQDVHYPALVILGADGKERFRYVGKNNSDRYSFDKLKLKIKELSQ